MDAFTRILLPLAVASALLTACGAADEDERPRGSAPVAARSAPDVARCLSRPGAASLIRGFFGALNSGNRFAARRFVFEFPPGSKAGSLLGFSLHDPRVGEEAWRSSHPEEVVRRLAAYPDRGQPWSLVRLGAFGSPGPRAGDGRWKGLLPVRRTAGADLFVSVGGRPAGGKVGFDCRTGRFYVWGMGIGNLPPTAAERAGFELDRPFVALDCREPNSFSCDRLYFFYASDRRLRLLGAWIDGRRVRIRSERHSDRPDRAASAWEGTLRPAGLDDGEGPLELPDEGGGAPDRWAGREPVLVPVALWVETPAGTREWLSHPRVRLAAGHG